MAERVSDKTKEFYQEHALEAFELQNEIAAELKNALVLGALSDPDFLMRLESKLAKREKLKITKFLGKQIPPDYSDMTPRMRAAFGSAIKIAGRRTVLDTALESVKGDERISELLQIKATKLSERIRDYLIQSKICYWMGLYEASIAMVARATEASLKQHLKNVKVKFDENSTLGGLEKLYETYPKKDDRLLKHIVEVNRLDRNISAHDSPKKMDVEEANHAWTAIVVIIKEIFGIKI